MEAQPRAFIQCTQVALGQALGIGEIFPCSCLDDMGSVTYLHQKDFILSCDVDQTFRTFRAHGHGFLAQDCFSSLEEHFHSRVVMSV